ncbi:MAG TPA: hypothetical protein VMX17_09655 [Candidatus Glassbacteria bacterium]|nr:hypothetical protein [Candidatus Glassbacteria bacterium]
MSIELATKISTNNFCYQLIGFGKNLLYNAHNRTLLLTNSEDGNILKTIEKDEDLDFDTFKLVAQNLYLDIIEYSN